MKDKYNLTLRENVFLAKKLLVNNIYYSARLEGCSMTLPDTQTMLDGVSVRNLKMNYVEMILNLRDTWKFILKTIDEPLDLDYICKINSYVSRNESYKPPEEIAANINNILTTEKSTTEKAIELFLWICRSHLFSSNNKTTALITANKLLISKGKGLLMIEEEYLQDFNRRLSVCCSTNDSKIDSFLYEKCIHGITFGN